MSRLTKTQISNVLQNAAAEVVSRIEESDLYQEGRKRIIEDCWERIIKSKFDLKSIGGYTKIIEIALTTLPDPFHKELGSKRFPYSTAEVLKFAVPSLRFQLQDKTVKHLRGEA